MNKIGLFVCMFFPVDPAVFGSEYEVYCGFSVVVSTCLVYLFDGVVYLHGIVITLATLCVYEPFM